MSERRKLTPFLAHEMLFDFATDQLDPDRHRAVEDFVSQDKESQQLLEAIRHGIFYADSLKAIEIKEEIVQELNHAENLRSLMHRALRWSEWPDSLRWSIIALFISACTAGIVVIVPWTTVPLFTTTLSGRSSSVEIARVDTKRKGGDEAGTSSSMTQEDLAQNDHVAPQESSGDEEFADEASGANVAKPTPVVIAHQTPIAPKPTLAPVATPMAVAAAQMTAPKPPTQPPPATTAASAVPATAAASSKSSRSFVYRAFMTLGDLENVAPKITQQIKELGAEKAGEVELGWRRGTGRYYHFSMPDANEQKLLETLRAYGPVRISKDPHPRVMPEGQVRFILWIESGS